MASGAYITSLGVKKQVKAQEKALGMTEKARNEARALTTNRNIAATGNWLFPDLLSKDAPMDPNAAAKAAKEGKGKATANFVESGKKKLAQGSIKTLAQGGTLDKDEPAVVGEEGPEVFVPNQPGEVVPNDQIDSPQAETGLETTQNFSEQTQGEATGQVATTSEGGDTAGDIGQLTMDAAENFLRNPGEIGTENYERAQEQANMGLQTNVQGMMGALTGMGIDPRSPMAQIMLQGVINQSNKMRNEAARNLSLQQEALKRSDIQTGMTAYQNFLNQVFNLVGMQAGVTGGGNFQNINNPINPYAGIGQGLSQGGMMMADKFANTGSSGTSTPPAEVN